MRNPLCTLLVIFFVLNSKAKTFEPYPAFIDTVELGEEVQVFKTAGENWKHCKKAFDKVTKKNKCVDAIGWPSRDAKITVIGPPERHDTIDPFSDERTYEDYVKVEFSYERIGADGINYPQKGTGYIELYHLQRSAHNPFYGAQGDPKKTSPPCTDDNKNTASKPITELSNAVSPLTKKIDRLSLDQKASQLGKMVGQCPFRPPNDYKKIEAGGNAYDQLILPGLKTTKIPDIKTEDGKQMTQGDLINIDALARTLYGEIGICYKNGLQYPMAVAKIAMNRSVDKRRRRTFIQGVHDDAKPDLAKAITSPSQFSMWQRLGRIKDRKTKKVSTGPNPPLHQGLCPPQNPKVGYYKSTTISDYEQKIWENTMRIATEAVLYPKQFAKRTAEITPDMAHYTSDLSHYKTRYDIPLKDNRAVAAISANQAQIPAVTKDLSKKKKGKRKSNTKDVTKDRGNSEEEKKAPKVPRSVEFIMSMDQVRPSIDGRKIDENACLEIWKDR